MRVQPVLYFLLGIFQVIAEETDSNIFQVFLLAGQSNMAGRGTLALHTVESSSSVTSSVPKSKKSANNDILCFDKYSEWSVAKDPLHYDKAVAGVGPGLSFAKEIVNLGLVAKGRHETIVF